MRPNLRYRVEFPAGFRVLRILAGRVPGVDKDETEVEAIAVVELSVDLAEG